jgi:hypothetical protein
MTTNELIVTNLEQNLGMLKMTLGDFSDADMLVRPTPGANHAAWQLGHLASAEAHLINMCSPGAVPELPESFSKRFTKETASINDPTAFPSKAELLAAIENARAATIQWVKGMSQTDLDKPTPEKLRMFAGTLGHLAFMNGTHATMHLGQFQVIRRKLGKPILF